MPARRELTMRQLRQMLRLHHDGVSAREIGRTLGVARSTIQDNLVRARKAGIGWPLPAEWSDVVLEQRLFARSGVKPGQRRRREPDWTALARELKRPGVNLMVLWEEYRLLHPDGYGYSRFCDLHREFERRLSPVMRQHHVAGDKVFVDYSGKKIAIVNPATGEVREAEIFVAVLGASNYTYAEATWTQTLPDWIEAQLGYVLLWKRQHDAAIAEFERALALNPNFVDHRFAHTLQYAGEPARAIEVLEANARLDPLQPNMYAFTGTKGVANYMLKRYGEAVRLLRESALRVPNLQWPRVWLAAAYAQSGQLEEATNEAAELLRINPGFTIKGWKRLAPNKDPKDAEHDLDGLRKAGLLEA